MNEKELRQRLHSTGIYCSSYALSGEIPFEQYAMENRGRKWFVFYSERGQRNSEQAFDNESDACDYLYSVLVKDPSTRKRG